MNEVVPLDALKDTRSLSFLPWAHCIGKNCELHNLMHRGAQIAIAEDISTMADNIKEIKPTILFAVPTLYKKVYDRIQETVTAQGYLTRYLVDKALAVAQERRLILAKNKYPSPLLSLKYNILDRMVLNKLRQPLGGQLVISPVGTYIHARLHHPLYLFSLVILVSFYPLCSPHTGGSAMNVTVTEFFENLGVAIMEGYGLTETSPLLTINAFQVSSRVCSLISRERQWCK